MNDGWIKHDGNSRPVPAHVYVYVKFRDGNCLIASTKAKRANFWDANWIWNPAYGPADITEYKIA